MVNFARYFIGFLRTFFYNFKMFFVRLWEAFSHAFFKDIVSYFEDLINGSNEFNALDWICEIITMLIIVAFFIFLGLRIFQILRRYVRFVRREIEKDDLLEEVSQLNTKTAELIDEKNKILALKVSNLGLGGVNNYSEKSDEENLTNEMSKDKKVVSDLRFIKLSAVDEEYKTKITSIMMGPDDMLNLQELVNRFINFYI